MTVTPARVRVPLPFGVTVTSEKAFPSFGSENPKSATARVIGVLSVVLIVVSLPEGSSLTASTSKVILLAS